MFFSIQAAKNGEKNSFYMEEPIKCNLTNMCLCTVCTLHVYDLYEWLRFCSSSTVLNSIGYKITSHEHISSQKHQNEKNDEKNHEERDHHDLPFPAGLLHDHSHSFLHKQKGRSLRMLNSQVRRKQVKHIPPAL